MTYTDFKKQHDKLVTALISADDSNENERIAKIEKLRDDNPQYWAVLWGDL